MADTLMAKPLLRSPYLTGAIRRCRYPSFPRVAVAFSPSPTSGATRVGGRSSPITSIETRSESLFGLPPFSQTVRGARERHYSASSASSTSPVAIAESAVQAKRNSWTWTHGGKALKISYVEYSDGEASDLPDVVFLPTFSDVSTVDEWDAIARSLLADPERKRHRIVAVDFPGFGASDSPPLDYTSDVMEDFLVDFLESSDGPVAKAPDGPSPVIIGAGHSGVLAARAASKGRISPSALGVVAPTWGGPLPIVFGNSDKMKFRYSLLRNVLRSPVIGWALYKYVLSSPKNIRSQYLSHVYADKTKLTEDLLTRRIAVTQREGARFAPAAFVSGRLDPASSREEFHAFFGDLEGKVPVLAVSASGSPRRSKAEMESLEGVRGVSKFVRSKGALLAQEENSAEVSKKIKEFLSSL